MYRQHFGLGEHPFSLTPDTQFFFNSESHCQILSTVLLALRHSEGFVKIVGEVGTGKTLLCRMLLASLGDGFKTAYIPNPYLTPEELKWFLAEELGITFSPAMPSYQLLKEINERLISLAQQQRKFVLVVDEAQAMPRETIEALRLLSNLETEKDKLLQVVLIGQPELDELLNRSDLRQLKQRIVFAEYLRGISRKKIAEYIAYRLTSAGYKGNKLLTDSACALLYRASGGVPRLINVIAHKALLLAYGEKSERVTRAHIAGAITSTQESLSLGRMLAKRRYWFWPSVAFAACLGVFTLGAALSYSNSPQFFKQSENLTENVEKNIKPLVVAAEKPIATSVVEERAVEILAAENSRSKDDSHLQSRIDDLLQQANRALAMDRLTSPIEDNAFGYYQKVLVLVPDNLQAKAGLDAIAARYLTKAQEQINLGNSMQAETFKQRAKVVSPEYCRKYDSITSAENLQVANTSESTQVLANSSAETLSTEISPIEKPAIKSEIIKPFAVVEAASINVAPNAGWKDEQMAANAKSLIQQNKTAQAVGLLKSFVAGEEKPVQSAKALIDIYLQQGNTQAVEILLNEVDYFTAVEKAKIKAELFSAQGNTLAAISTLEQQLSAADNNEQYGALLASLYHKTGQYQQSVVSYQRLLKSYGEKPAYWLGLALAFDGLTQSNNALQAYQHLREFPQLQVKVKTYIDQRIAALRRD